jgi:hypothetical protein
MHILAADRASVTILAGSAHASRMSVAVDGGASMRSLGPVTVAPERREDEITSCSLKSTGPSDPKSLIEDCRGRELRREPARSVRACAIQPQPVRRVDRIRRGADFGHADLRSAHLGSLGQRVRLDGAQPAGASSSMKSS